MWRPMESIGLDGAAVLTHAHQTHTHVHTCTHFQVQTLLGVFLGFLGGVIVRAVAEPQFAAATTGDLIALY
jgi:hypothetical protein